MGQSWQREQMGILGLEEDVIKVYEFVRSQVAGLKTWVLHELIEVRTMMATYEEAVNDAIAVMTSLSSELQAALAANDTSGVQAAADKLEAAAQSFKSTGTPATPASSGTADPQPAAPVDPAPADAAPAADAGNPVVAPADPAATDVPAPSDGTPPQAPAGT